MGEGQLGTKYIRVYCNDSEHLPSGHTFTSPIYVQIYVCVPDSETDNCGTTCSGNIQKIITLMEVKTENKF